MNLGTFEYCKPYISETDEQDVSRHGSPDWEPFQRRCKEDENLRKKIISLFNLKEEAGIISEKYLGSDGRFVYCFNFRSDLISSLSEDEHKKYTSSVFVKKTGNEKDRGKVCDLERFLSREGFLLREFI